MLKVPDPRPSADPDRSIGELIERLFDEALDYGRAELALLKAQGLELVQDYVRAAILFVAAVIIGLAGIVTLFVGVAIALARWLGPLGGAAVSTLLAAAIAGLLVWLAIRELDRAS